MTGQAPTRHPLNRRIGRRETLALFGGGTVLAFGLSSRPADATAAAVAEAIEKIADGETVETGRVVVTVPALPANGRAVPVDIEVAGDPGDVEALHLWADGNADPAIATFRFSDLAKTARVATRLRLAGDQNLVALAEMRDGRLFTASTRVRVAVAPWLPAAEEQSATPISPPATRIDVPHSVLKGDGFEVRAMIRHPMETGRRIDLRTGLPAPRTVLTRFVCRFDDREAFTVDLRPTVAANPFMSFHLKAKESGTLHVIWTDDAGAEFTTAAPLRVVG